MRRRFRTIRYSKWRRIFWGDGDMMVAGGPDMRAGGGRNVGFLTREEVLSEDRQIQMFTRG